MPPANGPYQTPAPAYQPEPAYTPPPTPPVPGYGQYTQPTVHEHTPSGRKFTKKHGRPSRPSTPRGHRNPDTPRENPWAGGRRWVLIARIAILGLIGVVMALGVKTLIVSDDNANASTLAMLESVTYGGFPVATGEAYGKTYLTRYLNSDGTAAGETTRLAELAHLAPGVVSDSLGFDPVPAQQVVTGPIPNRAPVLINANTVTFFYTVEVSATPPGQDATTGERQWFTVAVPVFANTQGVVTAAGVPAFVPESVAGLGEPVLAVEPDPAFAAQVTDSVLVPFFKAWAASDGTQLALLLDPNADQAAFTGLGGVVDFVSATGVVTPLPDSEDAARARRAIVTVNWQLPSGARTAQTYVVYLYEDDAGAWRVQDIVARNPARVAQ